MKKLLTLICLIFLMSCSNEQKTPINITEFWGIPFGASMDSVKLMMSKKNATIDETDLRPDGLTYTNCEFASNENCKIVFWFVDNRFYRAAVAIDCEYDSWPTLHRKYSTICKDLTEKYGKSKSRSDFTSPYHLGDGSELQAIRLDKTDISTTWIFSNSNLVVFIHNSLSVVLFYADTELEAIKKQRNVQKKHQDY